MLLEFPLINAFKVHLERTSSVSRGKVTRTRAQVRLLHSLAFEYSVSTRLGPAVSVLCAQMLSDIVSCLFERLEQVNIVKVFIQIALSCLECVELLCAVVKLGHVRELKALQEVVVCVDLKIKVLRLGAISE